MLVIQNNNPSRANEDAKRAFGYMVWFEYLRLWRKNNPGNMKAMMLS